MVDVIRTRNVHQALPEGILHLKQSGIERPSRNGPVLQFPEPVKTVYERPDERVMFWPSRDCNPFFHLLESLWMLAGRNDVEFPASIVGTMKNFSDDGETFNGAYGYRWRHHFGKDQLEVIIKRLKKNPEDRRTVIGMWDPSHDLDLDTKDQPCNLLCVVQIGPDGRLNMEVANRSNDLVWGAYGANAVHFSYLQEYLARRVGVPVGRYYQNSFNLHFYTEVEAAQRSFDLDMYARDAYATYNEHDPYERGEVAPYPLMDEGKEDLFDGDLEWFMKNPAGDYQYNNSFFPLVAKPMYKAIMTFKDKSIPAQKRFEEAFNYVDQIGASDWQRACGEWLQRRFEKAAAKVRKERAKDDGVCYEPAE